MLSIATRPSRPLWPLGLAFLQRRHRQAVAYKLVLGQASAFETPHLVKPHERMCFVCSPTQQHDFIRHNYISRPLQSRQA